MSGADSIAEKPAVPGRRNPVSRPRWPRRTGTVLIVIGLLNLVMLGVIGYSLGGHAGFGKVEDGRYYVASHGQHTEVSRRAWRISRTQEISALFTSPLIVVGVVLVYAFPRPSVGS